MIKIMTISESRELCKTIHDNLKGNPSYKLYIVKSIEATEEFGRIRPDLIILDVNILIPYKLLLKLLNSRNWIFELILISNNNFAKDAINASNLEIYISDAIRKLESRNSLSMLQEMQGLRKLFCVIAVKNLCKEGSLLRVQKNLEVMISGMIETQIIRSNSKILFIVIPLALQEKEVNVQLLSSRIATNLKGECAVIIKESILANNSDSAVKHVGNLIEFTYFAKGVSLSLEQYDKFSTPDLNDFKRLLNQLCIAFVANEEVFFYDLFNGLFLDELKRSKSFIALNFVRNRLVIFSKIVNKILGCPNEMSHEVFNSIEDEHEHMLIYYQQLMTDFQRVKLSKPVKKSIIITLGEYDKGISLEDIAQKIQVSKVYLSRIHKKETGMTVLEILQALRLETSLFWLKYTSKNICEISYEIGVSDPNYFSRLFKRQYGESPLKYRRQHISLIGGSNL